MTLKRKKKREYSKNLKIFRGVLDEKTLLTLHGLMNRGVFKNVIGVVKEGKESIILSGSTHTGKTVAIKVYCTNACEFKTIWRYLIGDPRFRAVKKSRRFVVNLWCQREFKNLKLAKESGVNCPDPIAFKENVLVMGFIGERGVPAPRLIDITPEKPKEVYIEVLKNLKKLVKSGLIHGDLSAYNILFFKKPYFIDLSHGTLIDNPMSKELLERDIKNINSYFSKLNIRLKEPNKIYTDLKQIIEKKGR